MSLSAVKNKKDIFYLMDKYSGVVSRMETEMLLEYLFNCARLDLYVKNFAINETIEELFDSLISRRLNKEPVQYITGRAEFMGLDFIVTRDVLIPRPETEILVNEVLLSSDSELKILDLCTGSGNIAISLAKLMPRAEITATDICEAALNIAGKNAVRHNVSDKISFYKGNLFNACLNSVTGIKQECLVKNKKFDIIICNPPYIKEAELPYLQEEVRFEPEIALNGGKDGLDFYRVIAKESFKYLKKGGSILLEIGFGQKQVVEDIFSSYNIFETRKVIKDFSGIERAMWINLL